MKRLACIFGLVAVLALPGLALAQGLAPAKDTMANYQGAPVGVNILDFAYQPAYVVVPAGGTVSWYNAGAAPHTVTADWGAFDSGTLGSGGGYSMTFWTPGTYGYHCAIHPGMVGTVEVTGM
jgi:plastocyanin